MTDAIVAENLVKIYRGSRGRDVRALDGVDLRVPEGTVVGLLGPNGAGKTTVVRILTTLLQPDSGSAEVAGIDVLAHRGRCARSIGLSGQYAAVDEYLTGFENLDMVGRLYHLGRAASRARARELLERFRPRRGGRPPRQGPTPAACVAGSTWPARWWPTRKVLFLDEPTTGLDPRSRNDMWDVITELVARRDDAAADDAVHGGGRPARRLDRRHRPRPRHRAGHRRRAEDAWSAASASRS